MAEEQTLININLAQAEVLARLPGIGEHLAARIVAHRETVGPFREVMGLTAVSGISERMVQEFANQITVGSLDEPQPEGEANGIVVSIPEPTAVEQEEAVVETVKEEEERPLTNPPVVPPPPRLEMMPPLPAPGMSRRRGCLFAALAVVLGALIGVGVTLGILAAINDGSLAFSRTDAQIQQELAGAQAAQGDLAAQVAQLGNAVSILATRSGDLVLQQQQSSGDIATAQADLATVAHIVATTQADITNLSETTTQLDQEIDAITVAAETFNTFLARLRDLLLTLDVPAGETVTPTAVPASDTPTPAPTPTTALPATRTPRPTATAFAPSG